MPDSNKPCILVIEDTEAIVKYVRIHFDTWGFEMLVAEKGAKGVELASSRPLAAVIVDITLPDMDGYAVGRALRQIPALAHTPLIATSGYDLGGEPERLAEAGFENKWLHKPFTGDILRKLFQDLKLISPTD